MLLLPQTNWASRLALGGSALMLAMIVNSALLSFISWLTLGDGTPSQQQRISMSVIYQPPSREKAPEEELLVELAAQAQPDSAPPPPVAMDLSSIDTPSSVSLPAVEFSTEIPNLSTPGFSMEFSPQATAPAQQLSTNLVQAKPVFQIPPRYPPRARRWGIEGHVTMKILVSPSGLAEQIEVIEEQPEGVFAKSARRAILRWRFAAPEKSQWQTITIHYELEK